jgi:hypothetical protein
MTCKHLIIFFLFLFFSALNIQAQTDSTKLFSAPLNIPMYLAGNFGEIRSGHFHAGIDIKTNQVEGLPVLAAADGYVSRVKISLGGYGNAIYITHPNGYTTAYGHLQQFNEKINTYILEKQYTVQKFTVEMFFNSSQIPVSRGDTIALSGNSGGSGGPHLHFEIRKTKGSIPQNPLKFGFDIKDNIAPIAKNLAIYPLNDTSTINGKSEPLFLPVKRVGSKYVIQNKTPLYARGVIGFGIEAIDKLNGSNNRCGVYNISLKADSHLIYSHQMDQIKFENTRFINTHVDFYETKKNKRRIQKSFLISHNNLTIYKQVQNKGMVFFSKYGHDLHYDINDAYGNHTELSFLVKLDTVNPLPLISIDTLPIFNYKANNQFNTENIKINFKKMSFYENTSFSYSMGDTVKYAVAPIHFIQNLYTPLHKNMSVSIKTPQVPKEVGDKFIGVSLTSKHKLLAPEGGVYNNGWITFKTRSFGPYTVMVDTLAPTIKPINFTTSNTSISGKKKLLLKVNDNLSGVNSYNAYIDGTWTLLHFDRKIGLIWIDLTHHIPSDGAHTLEISIGDAVNNFKSFTFDFIW